jgi:hypothetical protein
MMNGVLSQSKLGRSIVVALAAALFTSVGARAELPRRISASLQPSYYIFDSGYFNLENGFGVDAAFRYELGSDIYFENSIGLLSTKGSGVSVSGLDYRLNLLAIFPVLIPYRPIARLGIGFLSTNPVTVTPTETFRPTQTTFYFIGGAGITKSLFDQFLLEAGANFWITPYEYRIYRFDRSHVEIDAKRFMHLEISLGLSYTF